MRQMRDVASALAFLHQKGIAYGDLRSRNILVDGQHGNLKALLSDFGCAEDFGDLLISNRDIQMRDSLGWLSPEIWRNYRLYGQGRVFDGGARDMWAFGCTMVEVLARERFPWPIGYDDNTIGDALISYERPPRLPSFPPWDEAWRFIHDRCWCIDPSQRITAHEAITELEALSKSKPYVDDVPKDD
ncbi:kinase-like protein [Schizopora paradoxa]|uniref:Kinase-like protein n=1 Tax=Schizopora paradoxa TaxID=27342 RepID=A0A0H2RV17_9AGAM|nr:kinase-like protein [Schizopora paradoxa]